MKLFPFYSVLFFPLLGFAQDSSTAIIVEEDPLQAEHTPAEIESDDSITPQEGENREEEVATEQDADSKNSLDDNDEPNASDDEPLPEQPEDLMLPEPEEAVIVKVELPKQIKLAENETTSFSLQTPWAPKPMQNPPVGWRYIPADSEKAYPVEVKLNSGKTLLLSVIPYALVPESSNKVIQAREPGYEPKRGYQQVQSVSARLATATSQLEQAANSLDKSIENLSALVDSLPK